MNGIKMSASFRAFSVAAFVCFYCVLTSLGGPVTSPKGRRTVLRTAAKTNGPAECSPPATPPHSTYYWDEKNTVVYRCRYGFSLMGGAYVECIGGRWSSPPPVCLARDCQPLNPLKHGTLVISLRGSMVQFRCRPGFVPNGTSSPLVCIDGRWNGTQPDCVAGNKLGNRLPSNSGVAPRGKFQHTATDTFRSPVRSHGGSRLGQSRGERQQQQQQHHSVLSLRGSVKRNHDDWLSEADYTCIESAKSVLPPGVLNAHPTTRWAIYDERPRLFTTYRCNWGHVMVGGTGKGNVYCRNGNWVGITPKCVPLKGNDKVFRNDVTNMTAEMSHDALLLVADYSCFGQVHGDTTAPVPPPEIDHSTWSYQSDTVEGKPRLYVKYECNQGFAIKSKANGHLYCKNELWIGNRPACITDHTRSCRVNNGGCGQLCRDVTSSIQCSCHPGYELDEDQRTCRDIDECAVNNGECHHLCDNSVGSFQCSCYPGFSLQSDRRTCRLLDDEKSHHSNSVA